jgi:hypothetical protein
MKYKSKTTLVYLLEFFIPTIIAAILLWFDQRIFFLFFFFYVIWAIDRRIDYLRKIIRIRSLQIETKIEAIIKHLNIPDKKVKKFWEDVMKQLTAEEKEEIEKDYDDIM